MTKTELAVVVCGTISLIGFGILLAIVGGVLDILEGKLKRLEERITKIEKKGKYK